MGHFAIHMKLTWCCNYPILFSKKLNVEDLQAYRPLYDSPIIICISTICIENSSENVMTVLYHKYIIFENLG